MKSISEHLTKTIGNYYQQFDVLVLKGFANHDLIEQEKKYPHPTGQLPFDKKGFIDLSEIQKSFTKIILGLSKTSVDKPQLMDFESFIQLARNVNLDELDKQFLVIENNLLNEYPNQSNCAAEDFENLIYAGKEIPEDSTFHKFYANATSFDKTILVQYIDGIADEFESVKTIQLFQEIEPVLHQVAPEDELVVDHHFQFQPLSHEYLEFKIALFYGTEISRVKIAVDDTIKQQKEALSELYLFNSALKSLGIDVAFYLHDNRKRTTYRPELSELLLKHWGSDQFRSLQVYNDPDVSSELLEVSQAAVVEEAIQQFENGKKGEFIRDIFLTAPTGAGKSLLFQLPAIYLAEKYNAVTIVISPLIALMKDQVISLQTDRHYDNVAYINSELSLNDREDIINSVHEGEISIIYLSPELLLSYELSMFIGERELGLLVIDEAHLVTTWGRDFRVDYWYLGNYIRKIRKYYDYKFPVMAVTATAVYNGPNDMAFETLDSLAMENAIMYIGKVRREDIEFDIRETTIDSSHESEKIILTSNRIVEFLQEKYKTIVYCPWTSQLSPIRDRIESPYKEKIGLYFGGLDKEIKNETYEQFKANQIKTIISTKAFGMGVDIDDITTVYHHAPSGHLTDYVQEIGRVARKSDLTGTAKIDFNRRDLKFTRILYGLSSIKQYQVAMVLDKLLKVYAVKKKRNMLVSVDDFQYIFNFENVDVEQKVKSSLLLLEKDLLAKYRYNVLIARPKSLFTTVFVRVPVSQEKMFLAKYSKYSHPIYNKKKEEKGQKIFTIELDKLWEDHYSDQSFPMIKKQYFDKTLFENDGFEVSPQMRLIFNLDISSKETFEELTKRFAVVEACLNQMGGSFFTKNKFTQALNTHFNNRLLAKRIADLILAVYASPVIARGKKIDFAQPETFIQQKRVGHEYQYRLYSKSYPKVKASMRNRFNRMFGSMHPEARTETFFIPVKSEKNIGMIKLAYVLEAFDLATYEISGGEKPSVFIRLNDPVKLSRIAKRGYSNDILREVDRRQQTSVMIMEYFFTHKLTTEERWDFIESYFLGAQAEELIGKEVAAIAKDDE